MDENNCKKLSKLLSRFFIFNNF